MFRRLPSLLYIILLHRVSKFTLKHNNGVTWALMRIISLTTRLFDQQLVQANSIEIMTVMPDEVFMSPCPHGRETLFVCLTQIYNTFNCVFLNEDVWISIKISLNFVTCTKGSVYNNPSLVQMMACRRPGDKPLSEPMMVNLLTHICAPRPQWVQEINLSLNKPSLKFNDGLVKFGLTSSVK